MDVNGSLRSHVESLGPSRYIGVDIEAGPGVDVICDAEHLLAVFGPESFDVVISTELLEHVRDWRRVVGTMKRLLKSEGTLLITTRSNGFPYHGYPYDFWRYELSDMRVIFTDFTIEALQSDPQDPGVFIKARRPRAFEERDISDIELFSVIREDRCRDIAEAELVKFMARMFEGERAGFLSELSQLRSEAQQLRSQAQELRSEAQQMSAQIREIRNGSSYKLGRALTWPLRKVLGRR
jgi:SAM-dependent methyltransferase